MADHRVGDRAELSEGLLGLLGCIVVRRSCPHENEPVGRPRRRQPPLHTDEEAPDDAVRRHRHHHQVRQGEHTVRDGVKVSRRVDDHDVVQTISQLVQRPVQRLAKEVVPKIQRALHLGVVFPGIQPRLQVVPVGRGVDEPDAQALPAGGDGELVVDAVQASGCGLIGADTPLASTGDRHPSVDQGVQRRGIGPFASSL